MPAHRSDKEVQYIDVECFELNSTPKALLLVIDDSEYWIPKSQLERLSEEESDGTFKARIPKWLMENRGHKERARKYLQNKAAKSEEGIKARQEFEREHGKKHQL